MIFIILIECTSMSALLHFYYIFKKNLFIMALIVTSISISIFWSERSACSVLRRAKEERMYRNFGSDLWWVREMIKGNFADMYDNKFLLVSMGRPRRESSLQGPPSAPAYWDIQRRNFNRKYWSFCTFTFSLVI